MGIDLGAWRPIGWSEPGRTTLEIHTGSWRTRRPRYVESTPPCRTSCPASSPIALWIERARAGDYARAWSLLREENPFPAVTGRVCAHPCERVCNRREHDEAVAIHALERFVGDWGLAHGMVRPPEDSRAQRVAVVGGGPAGLTCAYHLGRFGYQVTVFEAREALGGVLRSGIPGYRLPREVLDREIELILGLGIVVETDRRVAGETWKALEAWDAVFVATGAALPLPLAVPGSGTRGIVDGLQFLASANSGVPPAVGARIVVIGGGSTAMDVARTARRLGARSVTVVALETRDAMPAIREEIAEAEAEGIEIRNSLGVRAFEQSGGAVSAVIVERAHLARNADGAVVPVFDGGSAVALAAETVLVAIGQRPNLAILPPGIERAGDLVAVTATGATSNPRFFAGGDVASRERTVAHAIGAGTRAARAIHASLSGATVESFFAPHAWVAPRPTHVVAFAEIGTHAFARRDRLVRRELAAEKRVDSFAEVQESATEAEALAEARRCFTCGRCVGCDTCFAVCPDIAIAQHDGGYRVSSDHCKGCGLCARECPRGALEMVDER